MGLTRRAVLLQGTALALSAPFAHTLVSSVAAGELPDPVMGFLGDSVVQLTVMDTMFDLPQPIVVTAQDRANWTLDTGNAFGARGKLNGEKGNFSGRQSETQPQFFTPWPQITKGSRKGGFRQGPQEAPTAALADQPAQWQVQVDGQPATIRSLFRKTTPVATRAIGVRRWESTKRHQLTFVLDRVIPDGATVSLNGPSVTKTAARKQAETFSESIHLCQQGYPILGPKKAYVGSWWGHDMNNQGGNTDALLSEQTVWRLISTEDGAELRSGRLRLAKPGSEPHGQDLNYNGCDVYEADFSDLDHIGSYYIQVDGVGQSFPFNVTQRVYDGALRLAARWYFHQRSGCAITDPYGEGRTRPRNGHPEDGLTVWQTGVKLGDTREGYGKASAAKSLAQQAEALGVEDYPDASQMTANPEAWGGWHDAGDWDRRIQHMNVVYHMADLVETYPHIRALALNLPESGKPFAHGDVAARKNDLDRGDGETVLPDLIHEALWGASIWRRTQQPDGGIIGGVEYSSSGILGSVSWNPVQVTYAYAPEDWAAYRFAHGAAKLGHVIKTVCGDAALGDALIDEALRAWLWAEQQPVPENEDGQGDPRADVSRARIASASVLYRATGHVATRQVFEDFNPFEPRAETPLEGVRPEFFANSYLDYVKAGREGRATDAKLVAAIENWIKYRALNGKRMGQDFGLHNTDSYVWGRGWLRFGPGSNWRAGQIALQYAATGKIPAELFAAAVEGMWFGMGCNPANVSFVQGLGQRSFADPLLTDHYGDETIPGQISFGVAGGKLNEWELKKVEGAIYPFNQDEWPIYGQIFESRSIAITAEHGMKSNALEWLLACALVTSQ